MDTKTAAIEVVKILQKAGYIAYFAGGWVRDLLMDHPSEDIDIATDASVVNIVQLFPHTVQVGAAFGVVLVLFQGHQFEVASFRKDVSYIDGRRPEEIILSTPQEDAYRRDFTVNGLFYDPIEDQIHDYVDGIADIKNGIIRTIGNPQERFAEDRLRMIRAIRFAYRFNFKIDEETRQAIKTYSPHLLPAVAMERIWQEFNKMARSLNFSEAVVEMHRLGILTVIFPMLGELSLIDLKKRVASFTQFPKEAPAILYLMELFPEMHVNELLALCKYFRASGDESKMIEFAYKGHQLLEKENHFDLVSDAEWAKFYADRLFATCFDAIIARYPTAERLCLIHKHRERRERLMPHIQRLIERKPLVTATMLKNLGILPGKQMGTLLNEAETMAIVNNLHDPETIIAYLRTLPLWHS